MPKATAAQVAHTAASLSALTTAGRTVGYASFVVLRPAMA